MLIDDFIKHLIYVCGATNMKIFVTNLLFVQNF